MRPGNPPAASAAELAGLTAGRRNGGNAFRTEHLFAVRPGLHRSGQFHCLIHIRIELSWAGERVFLVRTAIGNLILVGLTALGEATGHSHFLGVCSRLSGIRGSRTTSLWSLARLLCIGGNADTHEEDRASAKNSFHEKHLTRDLASILPVSGYVTWRGTVWKVCHRPAAVQRTRAPRSGGAPRNGVSRNYTGSRVVRRSAPRSHHVQCRISRLRQSQL